MANKTTIAKMFDDLVIALSGIVEKDYIFLGRPDFSEKELAPMSKYVVVELPVSVEDIAVGKKKFLLSTTGVFYLFVKSKKNMTMNVNALSDFVEEVTDLFPISGDYVVAANPAVLMKGSDEYGYQVVTVTFDVHSK